MTVMQKRQLGCWNTSEAQRTECVDACMCISATIETERSHIEARDIYDAARVNIKRKVQVSEAALYV